MLLSVGAAEPLRCVVFNTTFLLFRCEEGVDVWKNSQKGSREVDKCAV